MSQQRTGFSVIVIVALIVVADVMLSGCGSTAGLSSSWNDNKVAIDGVASEWSSGLTMLKGTPVYLGVQNDQDYLYLCLTSTDRQFGRQLVGLGLSVWFESEDGNRVGIKYPIGMAGAGLPFFNAEGEHEPDDRAHRFEQGLQDLEVLGPKKDDRNLFSVLQVPGISVKVNSFEGSTVYELKIPLKKSAEHPYAVPAAPGSTVKIDIEGGKFNAVPRRSESGEGMRGEARGPRGGGGMLGGGIGGGERRGGEFPRGNRMEPLDVSVNVHLSSSAPNTGH